MSNQTPVIFIVGSSRSGTTMFNRVLGSHPKILALNELHFIGRHWNIHSKEELGVSEAISKASVLLATARRSLWDEMPTDMEQGEAESIICSGNIGKSKWSPEDVFCAVLDYLAQKADKAMVTDQTPRNVLYLKEILSFFPQSKVVFMVRDPRAVLFSQKNRWKQRTLGAKHTPWWNALRVFVNYHPVTISKLWLSAYQHGNEQLSDPRVHMLPFERLVENPMLEVGRVCSFLNIEFYESMLDVSQVGSSNHAHQENVRGISSEVARSWEGGLSGSELWLCQKMNQKAMLTLGYKPIKVKAPLWGLLGQLLKYPVHVVGVMIMNPRLAVRILRVLRMPW